MEPLFIAGLLVDEHSKKAMISHVVDRKDSVANIAVSLPDKKTAQRLIGYIIRKNLPGNKETGMTDSLSVATDTAGSVAGAPIEPAEQSIKQIEIRVTEKNNEVSPVSIEEEVDPLINKYAEMISVEPQDISNYPLYRFIDKWYGTRYKWGGLDSAGIDCSAFSQRLYNNIYGKDILRTARQQHHSAEHIRHYLDANEGDLIFFRIHRLRISHVGVYLANGYFVHASRSHGVVISSMNDRYWGRRYAGCGRIDREDKTVSESDFVQ